ncbi:hypothetical protein Nepgr_015308 [Nepenthes gracilis]|uniref:Uncharacterized protein n=1 Tax=Nepenthes gracilis TaxID=150966 RepID=A0AAD3XQA6_NEPGR|nr:hypothetical protein Nepgr_015308 [Nepenthes gracilis]
MRSQKDQGRSTGSSSASAGSTTCQDCGNKAKRDCSHTRCRTCCMNRGYDCPTHVNSTWVPVASRRRHKHQHLMADPQPPHLHALQRRSQSMTIPSSGFEGTENFPAQVNFPATFRCIRVTSEDNVVDQYAYQTSVSIGGHTFKGILYDRGPAAGETSSTELQPLPTITATAGAATRPPSTAANLLYPSQPSLYSVPFNDIMSGMQFFPHPRP